MKETTKINRWKLAQYIAAGATAVSLIGLIAGNMGTGHGFDIMVVGFLIGIVSYVFGGFVTAVKMAGRIAVWGWRIAPIPFSLITFAFSFICAMFVFFFFPIIPVRKAYKD